MPSKISNNNQTYFIQSLDRALNVLECFSLQDKELDMSQIIKRTELHRTTATRIVNHLMNRHFLQYNQETKRYQLGNKLLELGGTAIASVSLRKIASPHLVKLRDKTGQTVLLAVIIDNHYVFIDKHDGRGLIRLATDIGWRRPFNFGPFGFIFLAYLTKKRQEEILGESSLVAHTPNSITDRDTFRRRLTEIAEKGYVVEKELFHNDLGGIAAPIRDYTEEVIASVGIAMPAAVLDDPKREEKFLIQVQKTADNISSEMGYLKP